jgi:DegV family protein with EDD domain
MRIALVTDSAACLPTPLVDRYGITVVPLTVTIDGEAGREGLDFSSGDVARALSARRVAVTTSRPATALFIEVYGRLLDEGADAVLSVHLSARLSGTFESAGRAAEGFAGRVDVIDSRSIGMGQGFAVVAAAAAADRADARTAAENALATTTTLFYVDTLEFLRRGGRMGAASALLGTALSVKPILLVRDGEIGVRERVRTASRALRRLVDLAVEAAGDGPVDLAVHHLAAPDRAADLVIQLRERLGGRLADCHRTEIGAAVGAHVGPGLASVVVHNRSTH